MKKSEKLFEAFTELDDDLIENALPQDSNNRDYDVVKPALKINSWKPWVAGVAVAAAAFGVVFAGFKLFGSGKFGFSPAVESGVADNAKYSEMMVDWALYGSAEELIENSDIICKAKVNDITFALIDPKTGKEIEDGDNPKNGELYTVYDINLTKVYKSNVISKGRLWFRVMGGVKGCKVDEQLELLKKAGSDTITVMHEPPEIELGEEYLFLLTQDNGSINLTNAPQGVYPLANPAYREEFSGASAQDIIDCIESQTLDLSSIVYADKLENENAHYSAEEIVNNEDVICTGTVTNISFAVLDLATCEPPTENSVDYKVNLFTIYDIELKDSYKGNVAKNFRLVDIGGIKGYKVGEQLDALDNEFLKDKHTIPVWSDPPDIKIGEEYLFVMRHSGGDSPCFFGHHKQTAFPLSDPTYRDEFSGASVKDIINLAEGNAAVNNYAELSIFHENRPIDLSKIDRDALITSIQGALATDCQPEMQLPQAINDPDTINGKYGKYGYVIDLVYNDTDAPLANGGNNKKAHVICHAMVLIGGNDDSYINYTYTDFSLDGNSEAHNCGTYRLNANCREQLLGCIGECTMEHHDDWDNPHFDLGNHHDTETSHHEEVTITHNNQYISLSDNDCDSLAQAIQNEMTTNCTDGRAITRLIDKEIKDHHETGYVIELVYDDYNIDVPLAGGGTGKKSKVTCHATVIIGAENEESLITISYTDFSADGTSEDRFGGTYILSANCRNNLLGCIGECSLSHNNCINHQDTQTSHHSEHDETHH